METLFGRRVVAVSITMLAVILWAAWRVWDRAAVFPMRDAALFLGAHVLIVALFLVGWVFNRRTARRELAALNDLENDLGKES